MERVLIGNEVAGKLACGFEPRALRSKTILVTGWENGK